MLFTSARDDDLDPADDDVLVRRCQDGDVTAFASLYSRHGDHLLRYCLRLLGDPAEAEDAMQEAFARAWKALPDFGGERRFYPWLSVIAHNLCVDLQRKSRHVTPLDDDSLSTLLPAESGGQDLLVDRSTEHDLLVRALGNLSERHREVLELREGRNWSYQQIASHSGVEVSTIETLLFRARRSLKEQFIQLARAEGALGVLLAPPAALRQWLRRALSSARTSATAAKAALSGAAAPSGALGGAAAVVATSAIVATGFSVGGATPSLSPSGHGTVAVRAALASPSSRDVPMLSAAPAGRGERRSLTRAEAPRPASTGSSRHHALGAPGRSQPPASSPSPATPPPARTAPRGGKVVHEVTGTVGTVVQRVTGTVGTVVRQVTGIVGKVVNQVTGTVGSVVGGVTGTVGSVVGGVTGTVGSVVGGVTGTVATVVGGVTGTVATVVGGTVQSVGEVLPALPLVVPNLPAAGGSALVTVPPAAAPASGAPVPAPPVSLPAVTVPPLTLP